MLKRNSSRDDGKEKGTLPSISSPAYLDTSHIELQTTDHKTDVGGTDTLYKTQSDGEHPYKTIDNATPRPNVNNASENVYNRVGAESDDYDHLDSEAPQQDNGEHDDYDTANLLRSRNTKHTEASDLYSHINAGHDNDVDDNYSSTKPEKPCIESSDYSKLN